MLQLLALVVPALVAAITTWRWPTLRRRIGENLTLLEKLPPELKSPVRDMLAVQLVHLGREQKAWTRGRSARAAESLILGMWFVGTVAFAFAGVIVEARSQGLSLGQWVSDGQIGWRLVVTYAAAPFISGAVAYISSWLSPKASRLARRAASSFSSDEPGGDGPEQLKLPGF